MANVMKIKRTSVTGRAANSTTLTNAGELAMNITDGIMYSTNGTAIFEIGANTTTSQVTGTLTANNLVVTLGINANGSVGAADQVLTSNGTVAYWANSAGGGGGGTPGGSNTHIQFNDSGSFGGVDALTWDGIKIHVGNTTVNTIANSVYVGTTTLSGTTVDVGSNLNVTGTVNTASANVLSQVLTDQAAIDWDGSLGQVATVTLAGNRTMNAPTNLKVGTYVLHVIQDPTGSRTLTWNAVFKWTGGAAPTLTTTASARDIISFVCDGTNMYGAFIPDLS